MNSSAKAKEKVRALIQDNLQSVIRYGVVSVIGYIYAIAGIYILIDICSINATVSYIIIYGFAYLFEYYVNLRLVFNVSHNRMMFIKYIIHIIFFWLFGSAVFTVWFHYLEVSIYAMFATIACLFPLRFLSYKRIVYK